VAGVTGGRFEKVDEHPAQVHPVAVGAARGGERRLGADDRVDEAPSRAVLIERRGHRVVVRDGVNGTTAMSSSAKRWGIHTISARDRCLASHASEVPLRTCEWRASGSLTPSTFRANDSR